MCVCLHVCVQVRVKGIKVVWLLGLIRSTRVSLVGVRGFRVTLSGLTQRSMGEPVDCWVCSHELSWDDAAQGLDPALCTATTRKAKTWGASLSGWPGGQAAHYNKECPPATLSYIMWSTMIRYTSHLQITEYTLQCLWLHQCHGLLIRWLCVRIDHTVTMLTPAHTWEYNSRTEELHCHVFFNKILHLMNSNSNLFNQSRTLLNKLSTLHSSAY